MGLFQLSGSPAGTVDTTRTMGLGPNLQQPVMQQLQNTLGGNYLFGGQGFQQAQQAAANSIIPQVQSAFSGRGRMNSGLAQSEMTRQLGDSFAGLYNNERNRQLQAASLAPNVEGTQTLAEPYFENDLATALGLLGGAGSLLGGDGGIFGSGGLGGALGSVGDALGLTGDGGLLSGLFGGGATTGAANALGNAGISSALGDSAGAALDAAGYTPSAGGGTPSIPGLDSALGAAGGAAALGSLGTLGNAGISSALGNQLGAALDIASLTPGAGTAGATGGLGSFAGAALPLAGLAAMGGLIASGKAKIGASKAAKEASIRSLYDQIGPTGGTVTLPGAGTHTLLPFARDGGGWIETANGGQVQVQNDGTWIYISPEQRAEQAGMIQAAQEQAALVGPPLQITGLYQGNRIGSDGGR